MASVALLVLTGTDMLLDVMRVPGDGIYLNSGAFKKTATYLNKTASYLNETAAYLPTDDEIKSAVHDQRKSALSVYTVIMGCQIVGIFISHQVHA